MLAEEMLQLLIFILGERYLPGLGECSPMQCLEREILHILCTGPQPFSKIERVSFILMLDKNDIKQYCKQSNFLQNNY